MDEIEELRRKLAPELNTDEFLEIFREALFQAIPQMPQSKQDAFIRAMNKEAGREVIPEGTKINSVKMKEK